MTPRGLRNNNPGNIDRTATKWQGMAADQSSDPRFVVFSAPLWGLRALARVLMNYQAKDGCHTLRQIVHRFAPPDENLTEAYVEAVAGAVGAEPDAWIALDRASRMAPLIKAVVQHENGQQPYSDALIAQAMFLAGVHDAPVPAGLTLATA